MAISVIGGATGSTSQPSVGAPSGMGLLVGGTISTGKLSNLTLRTGTYNLQSAAQNNCVLSYGSNYSAAVNVGTTTTFSVSSNFSDGRIMTPWSNGVTFPSGWFPYAMFFANNTYFAGATNGATNALYTSTNRVNWTQRVSGLGAIPVSIAFGNGIYVCALAGLTNFITSPDGITWTARTRPNQMLTGSSGTNNFEVAFGGGRFIATGENSGTSNAPGIWYSTDGINWSVNNISGQTGYNNSVAYGSIGGTNYWIAAGTQGNTTNATYWYSTDGVNFAQTSNGNASLSGRYDSIAIGNGVMVLCASTVTTVPRVTSNPTASVNPTLGTGLPNGSYVVTFDGTAFLARDMSRNWVFRSTNGSAWSFFGIVPQGNNILSKKTIVFDGTRWLATSCDSATSAIFTSTDGTGGTQTNFSLFTDAYATIN